MTDSADGHITRLLHDWQSGDREALDRLIPLVYDELRLIAARQLSHESRHGPIQTTALVNEAYMKLVDQRHAGWQNRAHFFAVAAQVMRRLLIDDARWRLRQKRGSGAATIALEDVSAAAPDRPGAALDVIAIDRALRDLERLDADLARIVEFRFFGGLTAEEAGAVLGFSRATVERKWTVAKAWLHRALTIGAGPTSSDRTEA